MYPTALLDQLASFIVSQGGNAYDKPILFKYFKALEVSRKTTKKEMYEAFSDRYLLQEQLFQTCPLPLKKIGIPRFKFININEFGML